MICARLFPVPEAQVDLDIFVRRWSAYNRTPRERREAFFGFDVPRGTALPDRVRVKVHRRTVRVSGRPFAVRAVIVWADDR